VGHFGEDGACPLAYMNGSAIANTRTFFLNLEIRLRTFARRMEMDRAVLYALLARVWGLAAGPVSAILIAAKFTPTIQGFYYTFGSILALQTFAELGIGVAITQFASHEWGNLRIGENRRIEGHPDSLSRLASLAQIAIKWYSVIAFIVIVGLSIGGYVFFSQSSAQNVSWKLPWVSLCILSGINLFTISIWSLLEGCNQVSNVYFYRFFQGLCSSLVVWSAILLGADLWTASIMTLAGLIYAGFFLRRNYWEFFKTLLLTKSEGPRFSWRTEMLPFQWRIAVSWASGYFIFSLFTPVLFHYHGPVIAGQMGMTWSLVSVLSSVGSAWVSPRVPQFGMLVAQKKYGEMDRLFWRLTIIITGITILGSAAIWLLVLALNHYDHFLAHRILSPLPTALFLLATIIYTASGPMATYLRAHKKEPLLFISVLLGVLVGLSTWLLGKHYSALGMAAGYLTIYAMIFPMIVFVWQRCRIKWHNENEAL
jgi:O-antigen/teichoic acid export membrane protein